MKIGRRLLSESYSKLASTRLRAFQKGFFKKHKIKIPVISIGNLTFGGTGKTPVTEFLMNLLIEKGHKPGIVCRAYKARRQRAQKINPQTDQASEVGDEALLLARRFPQNPVYSGRKKWQVAKAMSEQEKITVLLLDDGFQHLALERDLDIVLLDAMEKGDNYSCFPLGRARESWKALNRAGMIFLTKCNLASPETLTFHRERLKDREVFEFNYFIKGFEDFKGQKVKTLPTKKALLVSAIASPQSFQALVQSYFPEAVLESLVLPDHHAFSLQDISNIQRRLAQGFDCVLVTEKDFVKLKDLRGVKDMPLWQVQLELKPAFSVESLYAKLHPVLT